MRLQPITKPKGLKLKLAYIMSKRQLGKVMSPLSVVYARVPGALKAGYAIANLVGSGFTLDPELRFILQTHTAKLNDCAFCVDIARAEALRGRLGVDRVAKLSDFANSDLFTPSEKAALRYVEEATLYKKVSDDTFSALQQHFADTQIAEITLLNAIENYFNLVNIPLEIESDGLCALSGAEEQSSGQPQSSGTVHS